MITTRWPPLVERLAHLADSFQQLKERVREAVAAEMGKVVADAIRDWITTALQGRMAARFRTHDAEYSSPRYSEGWNDDAPWAGEEQHREAPAYETPPEPKISGWAAALSLGFVAAKWLLIRRLPLVPSLGAGMLLGTFALVGGPIVQASIAAAAAAADLVTITRTDSPPAR